MTNVILLFCLQLYKKIRHNCNLGFIFFEKISAEIIETFLPLRYGKK